MNLLFLAASSCGQKPLPPKQQAASQADLEVFNRRVAAATAGQRTAATPTTYVVPVYWHIVRWEITCCCVHIFRPMVAQSWKCARFWTLCSTVTLACRKIEGCEECDVAAACPHSNKSLLPTSCKVVAVR